MKRTLTAVPVMPATLNVIEKSGVGRRSKSPCVYIAVGAATAARNRSRNGLRRAFVIVGVAAELGRDKGCLRARDSAVVPEGITATYLQEHKTHNKSQT